MNVLLNNVARDIRTREVSERVGHLNYMLRALMASRGSTQAAHMRVASDPLAPQRVRDTLKSAVSPINLTDPLNGGQWVLAAFNEALRSACAFDAILSDGGFIRIPLNTRGVSISIAAGAGEVAEGLVKFVSQPVISNKRLLPKKAAGILVVSTELASSDQPAVAGLLGKELTGAVGKAVDAAFIAMLIAAGVPSSASAGATAANTLTDVQTLLTAIVPRGNSRLFFITSPTIAGKLATRADTQGGRAFPGVTPLGGELAGVPLLISDGVPQGDLVLIDGARILANSDAVQLDTSNEALLQMNDAPDSPVTASTVMTSLWQQDLVGIRAERFFGAEALSSIAAAIITGM